MPAKPRTPKQPVSEAGIPADGAVVRVEFNGSTFEIPKDADDWPTVAYLARIKATMSRTLPDWMEFVRLLLGDRQWKQLTESTAGRAGDFKAFVGVFADTVMKECAL